MIQQNIPKLITSLKQEAKIKVKSLVESYLKDRGKWQKITELETRSKFLDPLLKSLGWNFELPDEVTMEFSVTSESTKKKADYVFRINGIERLIVEANIITSVSITKGETGDSPQFQPLMVDTAQRFQIGEVSADAGYLSSQNGKLVSDLGGVPYIMPKSNTRIGYKWKARNHQWSKCSGCGGTTRTSSRSITTSAQTWKARSP